MNIMTESNLSKAIKNVGMSLAKWREGVQEVLINVAYQAMRANPNYANDLLCAIMNGDMSAANISGITNWLELFAPLRIKEGRFLMNKSALKGLSINGPEDFATYEVEMRASPWWLLGKTQRPESIFDAGKYVPAQFAAIAKKLDGNGSPDLAREVDALLRRLYSTNAWKKATAVPEEPKVEPAKKPSSEEPKGETIDSEATHVSEILQIESRPLPLAA